jgi:hypothetical protein
MTLRKGIAMSQIRIHITASELREGVAKRTNNPYKMVQIQGIYEQGNDRQIFRTVLPSGSDVPAPGIYLADFEPVVDMSSMELGGRITKLTPANPAKQPSA